MRTGSGRDLLVAHKPGTTEEQFLQTIETRSPSLELRTIFDLRADLHQLR